jgi:hypothetical protein
MAHFNNIISNYAIDAAKEQAMTEMAPYIIVGTLALIMFVCYNVFNQIDDRIDRRTEQKRMKRMASRGYRR